MGHGNGANAGHGGADLLGYGDTWSGNIAFQNNAYGFVDNGSVLTSHTGETAFNNQQAASSTHDAIACTGCLYPKWVSIQGDDTTASPQQTNVGRFDALTYYGHAEGFYALPGITAFIDQGTSDVVLTSTTAGLALNTGVRSGSFGVINRTSQTAAIATSTLCAATVGTACGQAGQYRISYNIWGSGTACSAVTAGSVSILLTWTDENGTVHSARPVNIWDDKTGGSIGAMNFNTNLAFEWGEGSYIISTNGTVIQYATGYTACTTGTGTYNLRITTEQLQ